MITEIEKLEEKLEGKKVLKIEASDRGPFAICKMHTDDGSVFHVFSKTPKIWTQEDKRADGFYYCFEPFFYAIFYDIGKYADQDMHYRYSNKSCVKNVEMHDTYLEARLISGSFFKLAFAKLDKDILKREGFFDIIIKAIDDPKRWRQFLT